MPLKQSTTGKQPSPPDSSQPAIDNPFTSRNHASNNPPALPAFNIRNFLARRTSSEILADLSQTRTSPALSTPCPTRHPSTPIPHSPPSTPAFRTPESARLDTTPSSTTSTRSLDTDGDVKMRNGVFTTPERRHIQQRDEIRSAVHDNFESERARLAEDVRRQVLASLGDEVEGVVRERVDRVLRAAVGEPAGSEIEEVVAVRERLGRMSDGARVRVFCTQEMVAVLRRLVRVVDLEMRMEAWTFVEDGAWN